MRSAYPRKRLPLQGELPCSLSEASNLWEEITRAAWSMDALARELEDVSRQRDALREQFVQSEEALREAQRQVHTLQGECSLLRSVCSLLRSACERVPTIPGTLDARRVGAQLTALLSVVHPDKWQDHPCATELTKHLVALRSRVLKERGEESP